MRSRVWKIVLILAAVPVVMAAATAGQIATERGCSVERLGDEITSRASAMWLGWAVGGLDGVRESHFGTHGCRNQVAATVVFDTTAGPDEVDAAARRAIDGLRGDEFAGFDVRLKLARDRSDVTPGHPPGTFDLVTSPNLIGDPDGVALPPAEGLLNEIRAWTEMSARYPGATVRLSSFDTTDWDRRVAIGGVDLAAAAAAFGVLQSLGLPEHDEMAWSVSPGPASTDPQSDTATAILIAGPLHDQAIAATAALSDRLTLSTPADRVHMGLIWQPVADNGRPPHLKVRVNVFIDQVQHAAPPNSASAVARGLDARLEATGLPYDLKVLAGKADTVLATRSF